MTANRALSRPIELGDRALGAIMFALAAGVVVLSVLGPLGAGVLEYHVAEDVENQVIGGDAAALGLVVPVSVLAGILAWKGRGGGAVLALAPTAFAVYLYTQLAIGGDFASRPGNSERFFLLFLLVFLLAAAGLVLAWRRASSLRLPDLAPVARRAVMTVLLGVAFFLVVGLHLRGIVDLTSGPPYGLEYTQSPAVFLVVKWMDLGLVVPLALLTALGVWRRADWAGLLAVAVIGWGALLGSAVSAMAVVMVLNNDPAASIPLTVGFLILTGALLALAGWLLTAVIRDDNHTPRSSPSPVAPTEPAATTATDVHEGNHHVSA